MQVNIRGVNEYCIAICVDTHLPYIPSSYHCAMPKWLTFLSECTVCKVCRLVLSVAHTSVRNKRAISSLQSFFFFFVRRTIEIALESILGPQYQPWGLSVNKFESALSGDACVVITLLFLRDFRLISLQNNISMLNPEPLLGPQYMSSTVIMVFTIKTLPNIKKL